MAFLGLGGLTRLLHSRRPYAAGWLLVIGWSAILVVLATGAGVKSALWLLPLSSGLAVLLLGALAGIGATALRVEAPPPANRSGA